VPATLAADDIWPGLSSPASWPACGTVEQRLLVSRVVEPVGVLLARP